MLAAVAVVALRLAVAVESAGVVVQGIGVEAVCLVAVVAGGHQIRAALVVWVAEVEAQAPPQAQAAQLAYSFTTDRTTP